MEFSLEEEKKHQNINLIKIYCYFFKIRKSNSQTHAKKNLLYKL